MDKKLLPATPSSYDKIIKLSFTLYRASFAKVIWLALLMSVITFTPRLMVDLTGKNIFASFSLSNPYYWCFLLIDLLNVALFVGIIWHMYCTARKRHEPLIEDITVGIKKTLYVFAASILQAAILTAATIVIMGFQLLLAQFNLLFNTSALGMLFTGIVFTLELGVIIYLYTLFFFFIPLIAIENKGILVSLEKSIALVWNHWWRTFSVQLTPWVTYLLVLGFIRYVARINVHIFFTQQLEYSIWTTLLQLVLFALLVPWIAALMVVQLKDLELRRELSAK